ncbi:hypothetical protein AYI69_g8671 [Smittium culicis]|uniref:Peptidase S1 domain-containing protein n=1 Tax=Smittium culicis TaxID=133412 RepID=A0A1R1X0K6_9FUNG|nr:hypothetical protein AYI69_g11182 [Smittium culicis]OMJ14246.1 hypothetical protein AYI69_g8671 [Smittium culicis]
MKCFLPCLFISAISIQPTYCTGDSNTKNNLFKSNDASITQSSVNSALTPASFLASLNYLDSNNINIRACSATIISPRVLVTNDLCVTLLESRFGKGTINIIAGSIDRFLPTANYTGTFLSKVVVDTYSKLSFLILDTPLTFNSTIKSIPLTSRSVNPGYSAIFLNSAVNSTAPISTIKFVDNSVCQNSYSSYDPSKANMICVSNPKKTDCDNYVGGDPILVYTSSNKLALAGIYGDYSYNNTKMDCTINDSPLLSNNLIDYLAYMSIASNMTVSQLVTSETLLNNAIDNGPKPLIYNSLSKLMEKLNTENNINSANSTNSAPGNTDSESNSTSSSSNSNSSSSKISSAISTTISKNSLMFAIFNSILVVSFFLSLL